MLFGTRWDVMMVRRCCRGSSVLVVVCSPVVRSVMVSFFSLMVTVWWGSNPMKEYSASFLGPTTDSKR